MTAKETDRKLVELIEKFYVDIVDDFKEAELVIINESKFSSMFKHKDYDRNIKKLRSCKKKCIVMSTDDIKVAEGDKLKANLLNNFERTRFAFNNLCDAYIQLQLSLKNKAEGTKKVSYKEYREIYDRVRTAKENLNIQLKDLDIDYTDYTVDDDPYNFL
ncbi:MAG: hypothetical protein Q4C80_07765 [Bacillota bacterium]|nr:hypothetical protein [Bacillota bacterium]